MEFYGAADIEFCFECKRWEPQFTWEGIYVKIGCTSQADGIFIVLAVTGKSYN